MIENLELKNIPFVSDAPGEGQSRMEWIKNGERMCAASTATSSDGTLNRPTAQVQQNVVALVERDETTVEKINEVIASVNQLQENLGHAGSADLIQLVEADNIRIQEIERQESIINDRLDRIDTDLSDLHADIGVKPEEDKSTRTVHDEMYWQKMEMGSYPGFDINGLPDITNPGSGLKYRMSQLSLSISTHEQRISKLENDWQQSDVGTLTKSVEQIRFELGPTSMSQGINVYTRLNALDTAKTEAETAIEEIKHNIGFGGTSTLGERLTVVENEYSDLNVSVNDTNTGLLTRVTNVEKQIGNTAVQGSIISELDEIKNANTEIMTIVGQTSSDGMRGQMADINTKIGTANIPNSIYGQLSTQETQINSLNIELNGVKTTVGDANSGLVAATTLMAAQIYGDPTSIVQLTKDGLTKSVKRLDEASSTHIVKPSDTGTYDYVNGSWVKRSDILVAFKVLGSTVNITSTDVEYLITLNDVTTTVMSGASINQNQLIITDVGTVRLVAKIKLDQGDDADRHVITIRQTSADGTIVDDVLRGFIPVSAQEQWFDLDWIRSFNTNDSLSFFISTNDGTSIKEVVVKELSLMLLPL